MRSATEEISDVLEALAHPLRDCWPNEARKRLDDYGPNELKEKEKKTPLTMCLTSSGISMILACIASSPLISGLYWEASIQWRS